MKLPPHQGFHCDTVVTSQTNLVWQYCGRCDTAGCDVMTPLQLRQSMRHQYIQNCSVGHCSRLLLWTLNAFVHS